MLNKDDASLYVDGRSKMENEGSGGKLDTLRGILEEMSHPPPPLPSWCIIMLLICINKKLLITDTVSIESQN